MTEFKKTCQICGRLIGAKRGTIAHHGYKVQGQRGWDQWFSGSCQGTHHLPYEESCKVLNQHIDACVKRLAGMRRQIAQLEADVDGIEIPRTIKRDWRTGEETRIFFTRENFEELKAAHAGPCRQHGIWKWGKLLEETTRAAKQDAEHFTAYIAHQQERALAWVKP